LSQDVEVFEGIADHLPSSWRNTELEREVERESNDDNEANLSSLYQLRDSLVAERREAGHRRGYGLADGDSEEEGSDRSGPVLEYVEDNISEQEVSEYDEETVRPGEDHESGSEASQDEDNEQVGEFSRLGISDISDNGVLDETTLQ
jgi:muconolactone delta-isomerase